MAWVLAGAAVVALTWLFVRASKKPAFYKSGQEFNEFVADKRNRGKLLSDEERKEMVGETRRMAFAGYDRLFAGALAAGKSQSFALQAGVLDAAFCVFANDDVMRKNDDVRMIMQCETVPFNVSHQQDGRSAIAEYLIWKIFPDNADLSKVMPVIDEFVAKALDDSRGDINPKATVDLMLRSGRFE